MPGVNGGPGFEPWPKVILTTGSPRLPEHNCALTNVKKEDNTNSSIVRSKFFNWYILLSLNCRQFKFLM